ncbi:MAG: site-specific integrase [Planctomycetes bacterium]|nr:site-specific integrase [Planctomycetota bacterium]
MFTKTGWTDWILTPDKFLSLVATKKLLETARERAQVAKSLGRKVPVRDYFIVDLGLSTGLRVMEMAQLKCGDVFTTEGNPSLIVRRGKCGKMRLVKLSDSFKSHYDEYILWKQAVGESTEPDGLSLTRTHRRGPCHHYARLSPRSPSTSESSPSGSQLCRMLPSSASRVSWLRHDCLPWSVPYPKL